MSTVSPTVSVVMGVYNGAAELPFTVKSVLGQEGVDLELIIVDDGSTDDSGELLSNLAGGDPRIRVIHQENQGLTCALAHGCRLARGRFIARQDCGDQSLPGRLSAEQAILEQSDEVALVSCSTRFLGPAGELLYEVSIDRETADSALRASTLDKIHGPSHHGCTMFRRDLYERVGGYRREFYFAQDVDLWTRLAELGRHVVIPDILYQASFPLGSISSLHRNRQVESTRVILECARLRRAGLSEHPALAQALAIRPNGKKQSAPERAASLYFVGSCLRKLDDPRAGSYFRKAWHTYPFHLKSAIRLIWG